ASGDEVPGKLGDQRDLALHPLEDHGIDAVHVAGDERHQRVERRLALVLETVDRSSHGARLGAASCEGNHPQPIKPPPWWGRLEGGGRRLPAEENLLLASSAVAEAAPPPNPPHEGEGFSHSTEL